MGSSIQVNFFCSGHLRLGSATNNETPPSPVKQVIKNLPCKGVMFFPFWARYLEDKFAKSVSIPPKNFSSYPSLYKTASSDNFSVANVCFQGSKRDLHILYVHPTRFFHESHTKETHQPQACRSRRCYTTSMRPKGIKHQSRDYRESRNRISGFTKTALKRHMFFLMEGKKINNINMDHLDVGTAGPFNNNQLVNPTLTPLMICSTRGGRCPDPAKPRFGSCPREGQQET